MSERDRIPPGTFEFDDENAEFIEFNQEISEIDSDVLPAETPEARRLREEVQEIASKISSMYWTLATDLALIDQQRLYKQYGCNSFREWTTTVEGLGYGKARGLVKIFNYFTTELKSTVKDEEQYQALIETAKEIGWAKARHLATHKVVSGENVGDIIDAATRMTLDNLEIYCKTLQKNPGPAADDSNDMKVMPVKLNLTLYEKERLEGALSKAKEALREGASDGTALALICQDFEAGTTAGQGLAGQLSNIERRLGVTLVAFRDPKFLDCAYGAQVLGKVLARELGADFPEDSED